MQSCLASAERVFALLDAPEIPRRTEQAGEQAGRAGRLGPPGNARCRRPPAAAWCSTPPTSATTGVRPLVQDLSFTAEPGQTVAIVGHTGAGKTTMVNLLMRFYELDSGRITSTAWTSRGAAATSCVPLIGMVLQDAWVFTGSIRENIEYGRPGASDADIFAAAEATPRGPLRARPPGRLRHHVGQRRRLPQPGAAAADHHREGAARRPQHPGPGRGDKFRGHAARKCRSGRRCSGCGRAGPAS